MQPILAICLFVPGYVLAGSTGVEHPLANATAGSGLRHGLLRATAAASLVSSDLQRLEIPGRRQWDCDYMSKACAPQGRDDDGTCNCGDWQCSRAQQCFCEQAFQQPQCDGFCGETSAQEASLWFGAYVTQGVMRHLIIRSNKQDMLTCDPDLRLSPQRDLAFMVGMLGFRPISFCQAAKSTAEYNGFIMHELELGHPVIFGVFVAGSGSDVPGYEHLVLVVGKSGDRWIINDHHQIDPVKISMVPMIKSKCDSQDQTQYCMSADEDGNLVSSAVAVLPPADVSCPARLHINGCADGSGAMCLLSYAGEPDGWIEPNWSVDGIASVTYRLSVEPAQPACELKPGSKYVVVKTVVQTSSSDDPALALRNTIKQYTSAFLAPATECFDWAGDGPTMAVGTVSSKDSVFVKFVEQGSQEHLTAKCP